MLKLTNPDTLYPPPSNYSHIVEVPGGSRMAFISGQVGARPDGSCSADFAEQVEQTLQNLTAALAAIDMEITDLVRLNAYITAEGDVGIFRDVRDRWSGGHAAASTLVEVAALASPAWHVEIEAVAARS
ncbi:MAG: RidA family protein [Alphaproteobacteria bacterium]|nr:RidA family protein [Alphaproteobacteria bacterium]